MANVYIGDIIALVDVILKVCDKAFSTERRPGMCASTTPTFVDDESNQAPFANWLVNVGPIYLEFRRCVHQWSDSFRNLSQIIENAAEQRRQYSVYFHDDTPAVDEAALKEIIDDCNSTLRECKVALEDSRPYAERSGPLYQYFFNEQKRPKIEQLTARIRSHDARISAFLKPFEFEILQRLCNNVSEIHAIIVRGITVDEVRRNTNRRRVYRPQHSLPIPDAFEKDFQAQLDERSSDLSDNGESIAFWAEPLAVHLSNSTQGFLQGGFSIRDRTVPPEQYINLLKCLWILKRLESHSTLCNPEEKSLWPPYISHLASEVSKQCRRFSEGDLLAPNPLQAEQNLCEIWIKPLATDILPVVHHELGAVNVIMTADLHSERKGAKVVLELARISDNRMKITMVGTDRSNARASETKRDAIDFDINTVRLIPRYAMPGGDGKWFGILIKTETQKVDLKFLQIEDALRFQQALTGFKVYEKYSEGSVTALLGLKDEERFRTAVLQLWVHDELVGIPDIAPSPTASYTDVSRRASDTTSRARKKSGRNWLGRKSSSASENLEPPIPDQESAGVVDGGASFMAPFPGDEPPSIDPLSRSDAPSMSSKKRSTWSTTTKVSLETGADGWFHSEPEKSMLVLFLKDESPNRKGEGLSFLTIKLDLLTNLVPDRCNCQLDRKRGQRITDLCTHAAIEQEDKKSLQAQLYEAEDLLEWDVNLLRVSRHPELHKNRLDGLICVGLRFGQPGHGDAVKRRNYFAGDCNCHPSKAGGLYECLDKHKSLFREVKEVGCSRLVNWSKAMSSRKDVLTGEEAIRALQAREDVGILFGITED